MARAGAITSFRGANSFLSNFHEDYEPVTLHGVTYPTAEHAFQAQKSTDAAERVHVAGAKTPGEAKKRGKQAMQGPHATRGWFSGGRNAAMRDVLAAKVCFRRRPRRCALPLSRRACTAAGKSALLASDICASACNTHKLKRLRGRCCLRAVFSWLAARDAAAGHRHVRPGGGK